MLADDSEIKGIYLTEYADDYVGPTPNRRYYVHRLWVPIWGAGTLTTKQRIVIPPDEEGGVEAEFFVNDFQTDSDDWMEVIITKR